MKAMKYAGFKAKSDEMPMMPKKEGMMMSKIEKAVAKVKKARKSKRKVRK